MVEICNTCLGKVLCQEKKIKAKSALFLSKKMSAHTHTHSQTHTLEALPIICLTCKMFLAAIDEDQVQGIDNLIKPVITFLPRQRAIKFLLWISPLTPRVLDSEGC